MGVIAKIETWWESLGLSQEQGELVDKLLEPVPHPKCENCMNSIDPNNIHDCRGVYDEVRVYIKANIARSTRNRLEKKYNCEYPSAEMTQYIEAYRAKDVFKFDKKIKEFETMRQDKVARAKMLEYDWDEEQKLWES